jgi:hypothetical protein
MTQTLYAHMNKRKKIKKEMKMITTTTPQKSI